MKSLAVWMAILILSPAAQAADLCAKVKAEVTIAGISHADGTMKASGTWRVGEESPGAMLEYRIQSDRQWAESRNGTAGTWEVSLPWDRCGRSSLRVEVFPSVKVGDVLVHCTANGRFATGRFIVPCVPTAELGPCEWECSDEPPVRCSGRCTGIGRGGDGHLVAMQGIDGKGFRVIEAAAEGVWTWAVTCARGETVSFRVRDRSGAGALSNVAERPCGEK